MLLWLKEMLNTVSKFSDLLRLVFVVYPREKKVCFSNNEKESLLNSIQDRPWNSILHFKRTLNKLLSGYTNS